LNRLLAHVSGILLLLSAVAPARADIVTDLYSAEVSIADQGDRALVNASRNALAEVLVKVSGTEDILRNPLISASVNDARRYVQQYAYERGEAEGELFARIEFDDGFVTGLVTRAGEPLWTANRPRVLVWLVIEDERGRRFVDPSGEPELAGHLLEAFAHRGVPAQLPLFDLVDSAAVTPGEAWRLYGPALEAASQRYRVENVLAGRLGILSSGAWVGDWSYFYRGERSDRSVTVASGEAFAREGAAIVARQMAARYAIAPAADTLGGVTLQVAGVEDYADYAAIVSALEQLELVEHANVEDVAGDRILLRLEVQADAAQLATIIELNSRFRPLPADASGVMLSYQWLSRNQ